MNVIVAYDGSEASAIVLDDVVHAGLPSSSEICVVSVTEIWNSVDFLDTSLVTGFDPGDQVPMEEINSEGLRALQERLPEMTITSALRQGSPTGEILQLASDLKSDLIVTGSQGLHAVERLLFGSVSHAIVTQAPCSVRISRQRSTADHEVEGAREKEEHRPLHLLLAYDGSEASERTVESLLERNFPPDTHVRIVSCTMYAFEQEAGDREHDYFEQKHAEIGSRLKEAGFDVRSVICPANPKYFILEEADRFHADAIVMGAVGHSSPYRLLIGSVSTAVAARAECSVEIIR